MRRARDLRHNRGLDQMVAKGEFREDLWFRINTFEITLPPLRERIDDILPLARHVATRKGTRLGTDYELFAPETVEALRQHNWPGNVRELANVVEHALILCDQAPIRWSIFRDGSPCGRRARRPSLPLCPKSPPRNRHRPVCASRRFRPFSMRLDRHEGNKPKAAEELGISLKTLYNKLNQATALDKSA